MTEHFLEILGFTLITAGVLWAIEYSRKRGWWVP